MKTCPGLAKAVRSYEHYWVINTHMDCVVESQPSEVAAVHATQVLNNHEMHNGREPVYSWVKVGG